MKQQSLSDESEFDIGVNVSQALSHLMRWWSGLLARDREILFLSAMIASSLVAFLPFSRDVSFSNYLIYAIVPVVYVYVNRLKLGPETYPSGLETLLASAVVVGSFVLNWAIGILTGDYEFGLTDYVVLVIGIVLFFYSPSSRLVMIGIVVVALLRGGTLALSIVYEHAFVEVSAFFVSIVLSLSRILISTDISEGYVPGQLIIGGEAGGSAVGIGWACAGLEELVIVTALLYILISSFNLSRTSTFSWLTLGVVGAFVINIVRMVILVWIAYDYGVERMLWVHTHLGDILFLAWIGLFWIVFFRFAARTPPVEGRGDLPGQSDQ